MSEKRPVIQVKRIRKSGHAHHGGQWKIAYADFVTAMMAFFLLLWLLNATTEEQKKGIAEYFAPTIAQPSSSGSGGVLGGQTIETEGAMVANKTSPSVSVVLEEPGVTDPIEEPEDEAFNRAAATEFDEEAEEEGDAANVTEDEVARIAAAGVPVVATLGVYFDAHDPPPEVLEQIPPRYQPSFAAIAGLYQSGVPIAAGADTRHGPNTLVFELLCLQRCGLSNEDLLLAVTRRAAA